MQDVSMMDWERPAHSLPAAPVSGVALAKAGEAAVDGGEAGLSSMLARRLPAS